MATDKSPSTFSFEKLNNMNYSAWAFKMQMYLMKENCWDTIEITTPLTADQIKIDKKAWNIIVLGVDDSQHVHVRSTKGGQEVWNKLKEFHVQTTLSARIRILKQLFRARLDEGVSMQDHLQMMFEKFNELDQIGYNLDNGMSISIVLASLNREYEPLITALEAWDESRLTLQAVRAKLLEEYKRKSLDNDDLRETALKTLRKDERFCSYCNRNGHTERYCRSKPKETKEQATARFAFFAKIEDRVRNRKKKIKHRLCFNCREKGHQVGSCPYVMKVKSEIGENFWKCNENLDEIKSCSSAKMARLSKMYSFVVSNSCYQPKWIIDSGASYHICRDEKMFSHLKKGSFGDITIATGEKIYAVGKGTVKICLGTNDKKIEIILLDVLHVPTVDFNLISVKKITDKGFSVNFHKSDCYLKTNLGSFLIGKYQNGGYGIVQPQIKCAVSQSPTLCVHEWHRRLAHRHLGDIKKMSAVGIKFKACDCSDICDACIKGKMSRLPFPQFADKTKARLECIVSDLCGPLQVESIGKSKYFMTFTDLFSGFTEVAFLRSKSEAPQVAIQFIEKIKTQFHQKPKIFRSDRGGEYLNHQLQQYLKCEGIKFQCTVAFSPQQNGVAERKNRTLMEAVRTLLISSDLPKNLWAEALNYANYTFNRICRNDSLKTPFEMFMESSPKLNFHEFGCKIYVMIPNQKRKKLDKKAEEMKFLGVDENSKGFRVLYDKGHIKISRDVKFIDTFKQIEWINPEYEKPIESLEPVVTDNVVNINNNDESESDEKNDEISENKSTDDSVVMIDDSISQEITQTSSEFSNSDSDSPPLQRTTRQGVKLIEKKISKVAKIDNHFEPRSYNEAFNSNEKHEWLSAMKDELKSIEENDTWTLTDLPQGRKSIGSKWVFKKKIDDKGIVVRYKARLVAQGFTQKYGIDYDEVFAHDRLHLKFYCHLLEKEITL